jgi:hypothetical protein
MLGLPTSTQPTSIGLTQNHERTNRIRAASPLLPKGEASAKGEVHIRAASRREGHKGIGVLESSCVSPLLYPLLIFNCSGIITQGITSNFQTGKGLFFNAVVFDVSG